MSEKVKQPVYELFEQAMKNYEQALQTGFKLQEDSTKWWMDFMSQAVSPQDWQKKFNAMASEAIPVAQKRMEESLRLMEQSGRASLDLLKQAVEAAKTDSVAATQGKMQELWETSLQALRNNAQAITQANNKVVESWLQCFPKMADMGAPKAKAA